jgi:hypothetical protein
MARLFLKIIVRCLGGCEACSPVHTTLQPWISRQYVSPKCQCAPEDYMVSQQSPLWKHKKKYDFTMGIRQISAHCSHCSV